MPKTNMDDAPMMAARGWTRPGAWWRWVHPTGWTLTPASKSDDQGWCATSPEGVITPAGATLREATAYVAQEVLRTPIRGGTNVARMAARMAVLGWKPRYHYGWAAARMAHRKKVLAKLDGRAPTPTPAPATRWAHPSGWVMVQGRDAARPQLWELTTPEGRVVKTGAVYTAIPDPRLGTGWPTARAAATYVATVLAKAFDVPAVPVPRRPAAWLTIDPSMVEQAVPRCPGCGVRLVVCNLCDGHGQRWRSRTEFDACHECAGQGKCCPQDAGMSLAPGCVGWQAHCAKVAGRPMLVDLPREDEAEDEIAVAVAPVGADEDEGAR